MELHINDVNHPVSEDAVNKFIDDILEKFVLKYKELPAQYRLLGQTLVREHLKKLERKVFDKGGTVEEARAFRPEKNVDPILFLVGLMLQPVKEQIAHAEIRLSANEHGFIDHLECKLPN